MNINDCTLGNLPRMVRHPISITSSPLWGRRSNNLTITVAHRLAHLIFRMESNPLYRTVVGAKWFLENINIVEAEGAVMAVLDPFIDRLTVAVLAYEQQHGEIDTTEFDKLIEFSGIQPHRVLYGLEIVYVTGPCHGEPMRNLARWISYNMWAQSLMDS